MKIKLKELKDSDLGLVDKRFKYPYCRRHGAMNKVTKEGIWRCVSTYRQEDRGNQLPHLIENDCKAGGQERIVIICKECKKRVEECKCVALLPSIFSEGQGVSK